MIYPVFVAALWSAMTFVAVWLLTAGLQGLYLLVRPADERIRQLRPARLGAWAALLPPVVVAVLFIRHLYFS